MPGSCLCEAGIIGTYAAVKMTSHTALSQTECEPSCSLSTKVAHVGAACMAQLRLHKVHLLGLACLRQP